MSGIRSAVVDGVEHKEGNNLPWSLTEKIIALMDEMGRQGIATVTARLEPQPVIHTTPAPDPDEPLASRIGHDHSSTDPWSKNGNDQPTAYADGCLIQEAATEPVRDCTIKPGSGPAHPLPEGAYCPICQPWCEPEGFPREQRPPGFDPDCHLCDIDRHICPGCGKNLRHGQTSCGSC